MNLGTGKSVTVRVLAEAIRELTGSKSDLIDAPARDGDVVHSLANIDRARNTIDYAPRVELRKGLLELLRA